LIASSKYYKKLRLRENSTYVSIDFSGGLPYATRYLCEAKTGRRSSLAVVLKTGGTTTDYFKKADCNLNDDVIGIGYPSNSDNFINIAGSLTCIDGDRLLVNHDSFPGCSGCPYVKNVDGEYFVIGSLIGSIEGSDKHNSIQSANSFYLTT